MWSLGPPIRTMALVAVLAGLVPAGPAAAQEDGGAESDQQPPDEVVVAVVNGQELTQRDLVDTYRRLPEEFRQMPLRSIYDQVAEQMVNRTLIAQAGYDAGLDEDERVQARLARVERRIVGEAYIAQRVDEALSEDALRTRYEERRERIAGEPEVKARHILVEDRETAEEVRRQLREGADFAELAAEYSTGPSADQGGDLGYFRPGDVAPAVSNAAFGLDVGALSQPVESQFGWHIIEVTDRRSAEPPSFDEIRRELVADLRRDVYRDVLSQLRADAEIEIRDLDGSPRAADESLELEFDGESLPGDEGAPAAGPQSGQQ